MVTNNRASVVHDSASRPPTLLAGDITPEVMRSFELACLGYFDNKDVEDNKQVRKILSCIQDPRIIDWIGTERDRLLTLSFAQFMAEFRARYLDKHWEELTRRELLGMSQNNDTFWNFAIRAQAKNSLLKNTASYLDDANLRHQLEAGMNERLAKKCISEKVNTIVDLREWMMEVKNLDDSLTEDRREWEAISRANRDAGRKANVFGEPSRRLNANSNSGNASSINTNARTAGLPKLTEGERKLLSDNDGCFKCRSFFAGHRSNNCKNDFPPAVNYKTLTQADVERAKRGRGGGTGKHVAVVAGATENMSDNESGGDHVHPVAAVLGSRPYAYGAPNSSTVIGEGEVDSDEEDVSDRSRVFVAVVGDAHHNREHDNVSSHLFWRCAAHGPANTVPISFDALIDSGSHTVLIREDYVARLGLERHKLRKPETVELAMSKNGEKFRIELTEYVKLQLFDPSCVWRARTVRAIVASGLCAPVILGLPFLERNKIVIDHEQRTAINKDSGFDLIHPGGPRQPQPVLQSWSARRLQTKRDHKKMLTELNHTCKQRKIKVDHEAEEVREVDVVAAIRTRIEVLAAAERLKEMGGELIREYKEVFEPIPHTDRLPTDVVCRIKLKDANKVITTRSYSTPRKWREAWQTLIGQHLEAGRIRPSSSEHASPAFIIPKADPTVLPRWVNDYRELNANTVMDSHPLPRVDDVLSDCAKGKVWSKMDMTNSFFQTRMHPDDVHLTAVTTPWGLYEWTVMPMGLRNAPPIHQRRMTVALRHLIGKICHIYLDDIVIWSETVEEHVNHIRQVLEALRAASLYCNPRKCEFFLMEVDFLGHRISQRGVEAQGSKVDKILDWPVPKSATDVRAFLGLVRYIACYLPKLADYTTILTPLTTKEARRDFPTWTKEHQSAFEAIKSLVVSRECLTVIDHARPGENKIFVTCDASEWRTGATLSYGATWETARPVAFDSMQLKGAEKNYPVHEKELLAIIRALKKWRSDLLGMEFFVYTDHRTLENFNTQRDLSRRQLRWQEFLSQYEFTVVYIPGENNTVADALSRVPPNAFPGEENEDVEQPAPYAVWNTVPIGAILSVTTDSSVLQQIKEGYRTDEFSKKFLEAGGGMKGVREANGLWYVGDRLLIPRTGNIRENLFRLAHDTLGHFGADKSYATLRDCYYWPNMRRDLETAYIPSCVDCQRNKSRTTRPPGPLHPLPVPDKRGDSVAMDFIGPLPVDGGFDGILTITDRLNADIRLIPTRMDISAEELGVLFFDHWYCDNGLPLEIISDRDKLFVSRFWEALHKITGVKLKLSTAFHPQTDGASERTNKTINQAIRFHVQRNQKGWARALPRIRFDIMNTVNASTGFSPFQLRMGRSPRVIPPIVPTSIDEVVDVRDEGQRAKDLIKNLENDVAEAKDNLLQAKTIQAFCANEHRGREEIFEVGDKVMLATLHRRQEYKKRGEHRAAKFFPRYDGPYEIIATHPQASTYTLEMPNSGVFPTFHVSELKRFLPNDATLFPSRELAQPGPIMTADGLEEYLIDKIIDSRRRGRGWQFLVRWVGYGPEHDRWLPGSALDECAAMDAWIEGGGEGPWPARR
jgi:hypothetical protein